MSIDIDKLEELKKLTTQLYASQKRFNKLSEKRREMSCETHTQKQIGKANADLAWHAMEHDKLARSVHAVSVDCDLSSPRVDYSEVDYHPSRFHHYRYQPRKPLCRQ